MREAPSLPGSPPKGKVAAPMVVLEGPTDKGVWTLYMQRVSKAGGPVENTFTPEFVAEIRSCFRRVRDWAATSPSCALVLASTGKFFSNGHDLDWLNSAGRRDQEEFIDNFYDLLAEVLSASFPVVAAVNGHAFAGGLLLALCADYRVFRGDRGFLCMNEVDMKPDPGEAAPGRFAHADRKLMAIIHYKAPHEDRAHMLRTMILEGQRFAGPDALRSGLVDRLAEENRVLLEAQELAAQWAPKASVTYGVLKQELAHNPLEAFRLRTATSRL